jgi:DNA polymerase III alpha subunit
MTTNQFGEIILDQNDVFDLVMQGRDINTLKNIVVDQSVDIETMAYYIENVPAFVPYNFPHNSDMQVPDYDALLQKNWHMPNEYKQLDIAEYILGLCQSEAELQRVGEELLLFQERNMFDLLRYLKYLVDVLRKNRVIWGVGRGSSVASYVLYLMGVHRIDSMFYDLNPREFLR